MQEFILTVGPKPWKHEPSENEIYVSVALKPYYDLCNAPHWGRYFILDRNHVNNPRLIESLLQISPVLFSEIYHAAKNYIQDEKKQIKNKEVKLDLTFDDMVKEIFQIGALVDHYPSQISKDLVAMQVRLFAHTNFEETMPRFSNSFKYRK